MAAGDLVAFLDRGPHGDMDGLIADMQSLARMGHPVLPADQAADAPNGGINRAEAGAIALSPNQLLGVGGAQLAVVVHDRAIGVDGDDAVVQAAIAASPGHALVDAQQQDDVMLARFVAQLSHLGAVQGHAVGDQAGVEFLGRRVIPTGVIDGVIQPGRVAGEEGLAESGQLGAARSRLADQRAGCRDGLAQIIIDGARLNNGDADASGHGRGARLAVEHGADAELLAIAVGRVGDRLIN